MSQKIYTQGIKKDDAPLTGHQKINGRPVDMWKNVPPKRITGHCVQRFMLYVFELCLMIHICLGSPTIYVLGAEIIIFRWLKSGPLSEAKNPGPPAGGQTFHLLPSMISQLKNKMS